MAVPAVFMVEGRRVVAGEAILNGVAATEGKVERSWRDASRAHEKDALLEALVREHSRFVYRIAYAVLRSHHDAEDATQETFLRVLRYSGKLGAIEDPKPWLARIAWRVAVDRSKQHRRTREVSLDDAESPPAEVAAAEAAADDSIHGAQIGELLEKLIATLPEKLRQPLILSAIRQMSPRVVAATLRINEAAVRSRVFRARQILREKLATRIGQKRVAP
jgi:RNA polymerase sigma-70 factor, ECF subfamily